MYNPAFSLTGICWHHQGTYSLPFCTHHLHLLFADDACIPGPAFMQVHCAAILIALVALMGSRVTYNPWTCLAPSKQKRVPAWCKASLVWARPLWAPHAQLSHK